MAMMRSRFVVPRRAVCWLVIAQTLTGCQSGFERIDRQVASLMDQASQTLGPDAYPPGKVPALPQPMPMPITDPASEQPPTINPPAHELSFVPADDAEDVLLRLEAYQRSPENPMMLDLPTALGYAVAHSREYKFAEEEYVIAVLRLLVERHLWGPRFFNEFSAQASGRGDDGMFDSSLDLVNEFAMTQRLPYGGEVSARVLAAVAEDLHERVAGEHVQSAEILLEADIPLLRGAGLVAREDLISAEREVIYAARDFEQFRREFLFDIAQDFLTLVVQQQSIVNAQRQVALLREVEERERTLYEAGRTPRFQAALAEQSTVRALDDLNNRQENFQLAVERFKIRLGIPLEQPVAIVPSTLDLPIPQVDIDEAVRLTMAYRLDLQTQRDLVDDARRRVEVARNSLLPDLNLFGSLSVPTDRRIERAGLRFRPNDSEFVAGFTLGLPLDREIERLNVRQAQINLERALRAYDEARDEVAVRVRSAVRDIDRARYGLQIQQRSIAIGEQRLASIEAAPDRATARDASDAANELAEAQDARDAALRDLHVAILRYLLESGQLRVNPDGSIRPLPGMETANSPQVKTIGPENLKGSQPLAVDILTKSNHAMSPSRMPGPGQPAQAANEPGLPGS